MKLHHILALAAALATSMAFTACKTTEANYRAAYQIAKDKQLDGGDSTVTAGLRNEQLPKQMTIQGVTLPVRTEIIAVAKAAGDDPGALRLYNVVVASFRQRFNATSYRDRLRTIGFPDAILVHNRDLTYFVVARSTPSPQQALETLNSLKATDGILLQPPFPYVLRAGQLVR